jgi:hypothetical protein
LTSPPGLADMARSWTNKILGLFGVGRKPKSVIPKAGRGGGRLDFDVGGGSTVDNLKYAIAMRLPVSYYYVDKWQKPTTPGARGQREGNPHAMWTGKNGTTYVHLYVDPRSASATGDLPGWRTFILSRIQNASVVTLGKSFFGKNITFTLAPGYNPSWYRRNGRPIVLAQA